MSYIALARKWRPRTFSQLVGQEHINKALINSLNQKRLHHAYLFTGTRGVGKTSIARLLAKALNCEQGMSAEPCLQCDACLAIEQGRFVDLIEIDGASRTRVEDTRELLENVQYAPTNGRFKIYLIDEVHMLSQHSFNALLKTLEEPPSHVKFLLATTDPQKLPVTVLSRCLQFNLKHLPADIISSHLEHILQDEQLPFEKQALELLAKAARGSMRDALSLLDQAIASSDTKLQAQDVKNILGYTQQDYALQILQALAALEPQQLIALSKQIALEGGHFHYVVDEMLSYLHQISISQTIPAGNPFIEVVPEVLELGTQFAPEDVQLFYQIAIKGAEDMQLAPTLAIGFEMLLLRMYAFRPAPAKPLPVLAYQQQQNDSKTAIERPKASIENTEPKVDVPKKQEPNDWSTIIPQLKLTGLALNAAENAVLISMSESEVILGIGKGHESVFTTAVIKRIEQGLTHYYKKVLKLTVKSAEVLSSSPAQQRKDTQAKMQGFAEAAIQSDPFFQQLQKEFSAELVKDSISALENDP